MSADNDQRLIDQSVSALRCRFFLLNLPQFAPKAPSWNFNVQTASASGRAGGGEMDCGRPSDRVRFISLISISGLHFHFHLLGSLLAISPFICSLSPSRSEWAARPSGRPLSDRCLRLPDETAETSGRWGGGGKGGWWGTTGVGGVASL